MNRAHLAAVTLLLANGCGGSTSTPTADAPPGDVTTVSITTSKGAIVVDVHHSWAPIGAARVDELVAAGFYTDARFFRVISGFVAQFGINGTPATNAMWDAKAITDDPVGQSNTRGYLSFAQTSAPNSRTTQLFINTVDNSFLDAMGFAPFAVVTSGMDVVDKLDAEYGESPDQAAITSQGNPYLEANFPNLDYVVSTVVQ